MVDYRKFRLNRLNDPEFSHVKLLLYWPLYGLAFLLLERFRDTQYHMMYWPAVDDKIPFLEAFVIPYYFWFAFIGWILVYSFFFDIPTFRKYMWFTIFAYTATCIIFLVYPSEQGLRPATFEHQNIFTAVVGWLYSFDTDTNVCPSLHVVGSFAVMFAAWHSKRYGTTAWRIAFTVMTFFISISTVFLKQHSMIDIIVGVVLSFAIYPFVFLRKPKKKLLETPQNSIS